jgi:hypothetical protein
METFALVFFFVGIVVALINPLVGFYWFFIIAYARPQDFYPVFSDLEPAKWMLIVTAVSAFFHKLGSKENLTKANQNYALIGLLIMILISRLAALNPIAWAEATQDFFRIFLVYFLIINYITTPKRLKAFYIFFLLLNLFVALRFYIAYKGGFAIAHGGSKPGDITYGFLANADDLGLGLVVALPFALIPIFYANNILIKGICAFMSLCFILGALGTQSRGSQIGLFAVFISALLSQLRWKKLTNRKFAIGIVVVAMLFAGFIYKYRYSLHDSYISIQNEADQGRVGRESTWAIAKQMIKDKPLTGVGRGNFIPYWQIKYPSGVFGYQVAHNIILEVAAEIGLIGLLFFLYFSLYGIKEIRSLVKHQKKKLQKNDFLEMIFTIYLISLIGFYFNGMFITVAFYWHIYVLVALFVSARAILLSNKTS